VTVDVLVNHHLFEGAMRSALEQRLRGLKRVRQHGGTSLIERLLQETIAPTLNTQTTVPIARLSDLRPSSKITVAETLSGERIGLTKIARAPNDFC